MRRSFSSIGIARLRQEAIALQRQSKSLSRLSALNQIARREHWPNWALLQRNSAAFEDMNSALTVKVEPFVQGDRGVFIVKIKINDVKIRDALERAGDFHFYLPVPPERWIIRRFTDIRTVGPTDPYHRLGPDGQRGRFVDGQCFFIVSTNGVSPDTVEGEIDRHLHAVSAEIRYRLIQTVQAFIEPVAPPPSFTLLYTLGSKHDVSIIQEAKFPTIEEAMAANLPEGTTPIGIPTEAGWWTYQAAFGWQAPSAR